MDLLTAKAHNVSYIDNGEDTDRVWFYDDEQDDQEGISQGSRDHNIMNSQQDGEANKNK